MSVATLNVFHHNNAVTIGASHSYCFYQELSVKSSSTLRQPKQIIPSIPRQHFKAPKNSSLSPIRSQKVMPKNDDKDNLILQQPKRPYPLVNTFSSPASIQTVKSLKQQQRKRKVSFNEKVVVVCTVFDEESDEEDEIPPPRRHSTGETNSTNLKSILIHPHQQQQQQQQQQKFATKSLKQFKKLFS